MNAYDFAGKYAVVTGGAGGIGQAVGRMLRDCGATVSLWDVLAKVHELKGPRLHGRQVDITDAAQVFAAVKADAESFGRIDVLVNNAGVLGEIKPLWETSVEDLRRVLDLNLLGAMLCSRAILPLMRAQAATPQRGHIVNVSCV